MVYKMLFLSKTFSSEAWDKFKTEYNKNPSPFKDVFFQFICFLGFFFSCFFFFKEDSAGFIFVFFAS